MGYRRTTRLLLALTLGAALRPSVLALAWPALAAWLPGPLSAHTLLIAGSGAGLVGALAALIASRRVLSAFARRLRARRPLSLTRQSARAFQAASTRETRAANDRHIAALATLGRAIPGFTTGVQSPALDHETSILVYLRGSGRAGATTTEMLESIGIAPQDRDRALRTLESAGFVARAGDAYHITESGEARIGHI